MVEQFSGIVSLTFYIPCIQFHVFGHITCFNAIILIKTTIADVSSNCHMFARRRTLDLLAINCIV